MASSLEGNKIFAAILTAGIIASGSGVFSRILYSPHQLEEPAYPIEGGAATTAEPAEAVSLPVLLAAADPGAGERAARRCVSCHSFEQGGPDKVGPNLWSIVGRPVGADPDFSYSEALGGHGGNWDYQLLDEFIANPRASMPGTRMAFAGINNAEERANLLAYMRTLADQPVPLPEG
ncbi:MAG TPA: cytochrome c family protein [Geminicoccaceae bacterium]|nr:cytochrome c family protein [Geminicoccaceae bacterium]